MNLFLNNPPRWLAKALGIVSGGAAPAITHELYQTADALQSGLGAVKSWTLQNSTGAVAAAVTVDITADEDSTRLVRCGLQQSANVASQFQARLFGPGSIAALYIASLNTAAANPIPWQSLEPNAPYWILPPNFRMTLTIFGQPGQIAAIDYEILTVPAGTKPW